MDRITGNQAKSLMEAYAQVYTKPAVENLNEQVKRNKEGEDIQIFLVEDPAKSFRLL